MNDAVIVVVYNRFLGESEAGKTLPSAVPGNTKVLIYDNSETDYENASFCAAHGWHYLGGGGNVGLSKAYNACVAALRRLQFDGIVCLFDDDTQVSPDYFSALNRAAEDRPDRQLFFPILLAGGKIVSPQIIRPNQHAAFFETDEACLAYGGEELFAFNSGMAVRASVFEQIAYDEALFLDGIDYAFLRSCYQSGFSACVLPVRMSHGFSGAQRPSREGAKKRFRNYAADFAVVLRETPGAYRYLVGKRALHLALIYHDVSFLSIFHRARPVGKKSK